MLILCKFTSEHLLSAILTTCKYVFESPGTRNKSRENNTIYSRFIQMTKTLTQVLPLSF